MKAFADQVAYGLRGRGYVVQELTAPVWLRRIFSRPLFLAKWLGYLDQFLFFPFLLKFRASRLPQGSLCVLTDQALGPWLPWLSDRPHIIHCHDLLSLDASFGIQPFHRLSFSGRLYQRWILRGFRRGCCFLSVSAATQRALEPYLPQIPKLSAVVYNPLPARFSPIPQHIASACVLQALPQLREQPFIFHIGRNWYKNRFGLMLIWEQLHQLGCHQHLVLIGALDSSMQGWLLSRHQLWSWLHVLNRADDNLVVSLYNRASLLLFPSHAEGFGWPIAEALACGCPVITTNLPPMTEVGGDAVTTVPPAPSPPCSLDTWSFQAALQVQKVLARSHAVQERYRQLGFYQVRRFQLDPWLDELETYYKQALDMQVSV
jgi:glycosyltransferase involved in cell wall biosynthesis